MGKKGFSLVSIIIAMGLLGIMVSVMASIVSYQMKAQRSATAKSEAMDLKMDILELLSHRNICEMNFQNVNPTTDPNSPNPTQIVDEGGGVRISETNTYGNIGIIVDSISLANYQPYANAGADRFKGTVDLNIVVDTLIGGKGLQKILRSLKLAVHLKGFTGGAPAWQIETCVGLGQSLENVWRAKTNGDIYFVGNSVAIGTTDPVERLHVEGNIQATAFLYPSDRRLKKEITSASGLEAILQLQGVDFRWKNSNALDSGVIAQDVEAVFPHLVHTDDSGFKTVNGMGLLGPIIESLRDLKLENQSLKDDLDSLRERIHKGR